jgi:hypothetical protein
VRRVERFGQPVLGEMRESARSWDVELRRLDGETTYPLPMTERRRSVTVTIVHVRRLEFS